MRRQLRGWTISVLQRPYEVLRLFGTSFASVGHLLQDASQGVIKIKDLMHMIAANRPALLARMELLDTSRSVARAVLLDAENEEFTRVSTSFAGLPELLDRIMQRMSAATRIPVTLLMGRSAAGMNATGDSDFRAFYDSVKSEQRDRLEPVLLQIYRLLAIARGEDPEGISIEFHPLWEMSEAERALLEKQDAERDSALITSGVLYPEEVALRIARGRRSVTDTEIDEKAREASLAIELKMMQDPEQHKDPALEPKEDPEESPGEGAMGTAKPKPIMTKS
jgi:phage-related protein (TIGR01555 family)